MDPMTIAAIVSALLPVLMACFQKQSGTNADHKAFLLSHRKADGTYDQSLVDQARPRTRREARHQGHKHLSKADLDLLTTHAFEKAVNATDAEVATCRAAAALLANDGNVNDDTDQLDDE